MAARGADRTGGAVPDGGGAGHVYGPVPSRRLGRSLGVDLVPMKTCPYDCIYCQLGPTRTLTVRRQTFAPVASIVDEVRRALDRRAPPDAITLAALQTAGLVRQKRQGPQSYFVAASGRAHP